MSAVTPRRRAMVRGVRFFVERPMALITALAAVLVIIALAVAVPLVLPRTGLNLSATASAPAATEAYMRGNRDFNADLMWSSLGDEARQRYAAQGGSEQTLQQQLEAARQAGRRLEDVSYIGGHSMPDGTSMQFYLVGIRPDADAAINYVPYMFTLDRQGKIARVQ